MKKIKYLIPAIAMVFGLASCENMDVLYKDQKIDYSIYSSKASGLAIQPGYQRATLTWNVPVDQVATGVELSWNEGADVVKFDSLATTYMVEGLTSATYTFEVRTFDAYGNLSLPISASAKVYGPDDTRIFTVPSFTMATTSKNTHSLTIKNLSGAMNMWGGKLVVTLSNGTESQEIDLSQTFNILEKKNSGYYSRLVDKTVDLGVALPAGEYTISCTYNEHCTSFKQKQSGVYYYTAICVDPLEYTVEGKVTAAEIVVPEPEETPAE
ncbi:MAG: hypothetical protein IKY80_00995 [Alistipes sp.]|nr:hypothetical protein [Alistipes sp.]